MNDFAREWRLGKELKDYRVDRFVLCPRHWVEFANPIRLKWRRVKFNTANMSRVPNDARGVYTFVADPRIANHPATSYLLYVGMVHDSDFQTRFQSYLAEPRKKKPRDHILYMLDRWCDHLWFYYAEVHDPDDIPVLEDDLIYSYLPPVNRKFPAKIRRAVRLVFS